MAPIDELDSYAARRERKAWAAVGLLALLSSSAVSVWLLYELFSWLAWRFR